MSAILDTAGLLHVTAMVGAGLQALVHYNILKRRKHIAHGAWLAADVSVGLVLVAMLLGPWPNANWFYALLIMMGSFSLVFRTVLNGLMKWGVWYMGNTAKYDRFWRFWAFIVKPKGSHDQLGTVAAQLAMAGECVAMLWGYMHIMP